jgi:cell division protease FtsH
MVTVFGMSESLGPIAFGQKEEAIFLGREIAQHRDYSEQTAIKIDEEVRRIVDEAHQTAKKILSEHEDLLHTIAEKLIERETLDGKEMDAIIEAAKPGLSFTRTVSAEDVTAEERAKTEISQPKPEPKKERDPVTAKEKDLPKDKLGETQA